MDTLREPEPVPLCSGWLAQSSPPSPQRSLCQGREEQVGPHWFR